MEIMHFKSQSERLKYLKGRFEEIIPQEAEEEPKPKKKAKKKEKKDEVSAE